eukprot:597216-Heterocapsa_arctica.AAC.1
MSNTPLSCGSCRGKNSGRSGQSAAPHGAATMSTRPPSFPDVEDPDVDRLELGDEHAGIRAA